MAHAVLNPLLRPEFNAFLLAEVGADANEMPLSVLSALVRLDVDPWQEAAGLARLPAPKATQRLTSLLAALPEAVLAPADAGILAPRLIGLLPQRFGPAVAHVTGSGGVAERQSPATIALMLTMGVLLCVIWLSASREAPQHARPAPQEQGAREAPPGDPG